MITVIAVNVGHAGEDILLMPGSADVDDPSAAVPDILKLVVLELGALPLRA